MKILITGAGGMLGTALYNGLKDRHCVFGLDRQQVNCENFIKADITDTQNMEVVISNLRPNIIINCSAMIDVAQCEDELDAAMLINATAAGNLSYLSQKYGARIIYISTSMVFDGLKAKDYIETDIPNPLNVYSHTKYGGEILTAKYCKKHIIIRTNIFGWKPGSFGYWIYDSVTTQKKVKLFTDIIFNCIYVNDMVKHIENLFTAEPGIYHLTSRDSMSKYDFGNTMMKLLGEYDIINKNVSAVKYSNHNVDGIKRPNKAVLNCSKYEKAFSRLPTMKETLRRFLADNPFWKGYNDGMR